MGIEKSRRGKPPATGGYVAAVVAAEEARIHATQKAGANAAARKAAHLASLDGANRKVAGSGVDLAPTAARLRGFARKSKEVARVLDDRGVGEEGLTEEQAAVVMDQVVDGKVIGEMVAATYEAVRQAVFITMDIAAAEAGEPEPSQTPMVLDVPSLGRRFSRENCGRGRASLDFEALEESLGPEVWAAVTVERTVRVLDEDALVEAVADDPSVLERVRAAVRPGEWKTPRLLVRDIPADESTGEVA